ncbi:MAG: hypothetical protein MZU79_03070 [Anaerotruncus sp.]|nr:hypothetical protein [Anaerotruncus sp.]
MRLKEGNLAAWIIDINKSRKQLMTLAYEQMPEIEEGNKSFVYLSSEKEGMLGLLANRLVNRYAIPIVVLTTSGDDQNGKLIGSARTRKVMISSRHSHS